MSQITLKPLDDGPKAVEIPFGKTTIGRGPFLGCSDKKVSRNHAVLEVTNKSEVFLTPTHVNPCFYQPTADSPGQILKKDVPHKLESGDTFSLLPRAYRYQLIVAKDDIKTDHSEPSEEHSQPNGTAVETSEDPEPIKGLEEQGDTIVSEKPFAKEDVDPPKEESPTVTEDSVPQEEPAPQEVTEAEKVTSEENESTVHLDTFPKSHEEEEEEEEASKDGKIEKKDNCDDESREPEDPFELPPEKDDDEPPKNDGVTLKRPKKKGPKPRQTSRRKGASNTESQPKPRGRKKAAKLDFSDDAVRTPGRTSGRTNRQTRQGLSLEDFIVSDDDEWQSDERASQPKRRRKRRGSDSGSDWETEHKRPRKHKLLGSGSESGSDWGTHKKGGPKGRRRKTRTPSEEEPTPSSAPKPDKPRIPCSYGKKCYRRNQNHTEQFSHPGDSDYASDVESAEPETPKKECPYGENCFRKNPQHKKDFKHTKKVRPQREAAKKADKKTKGSRTSEELDSYDLNDSFLADDSADEYKPQDSGSDYESGEKRKKGKRGKAKV